MAATIACASDPFAIANTMPTTMMSSDDAADDVKTAAVWEALSSLPRLCSAQNPANSGTADDNVAADAVLEHHTRRSRVRNPPPKYSDNIVEGAAPLKQGQTSKFPLAKSPLHPNQRRKQLQLLIQFN